MPEISEGKLNKLETSLAVMQSSIDRQSEAINKLTETTTQLSVYIEKTNQNDDKITAIFKKLDHISAHGTQMCPVHNERLEAFEKELRSIKREDIALVDRKVNALITYFISIGGGIVVVLVGLIMFLIEHKII